MNMVEWFQGNWSVVAVIFFAGLFLGWFCRFTMRAIAGVATIVGNTDGWMREGDRISKVYNEIYPMGTKMQTQINELGGHLWRVRTFHDHADELAAFRRDIADMKQEIIRIGKRVL